MAGVGSSQRVESWRLVQLDVIIMASRANADTDDFLLAAHDDNSDAEDDDEIDLEAYEAYLDEMKRKAAEARLSSSSTRLYPSEAPQFYMVTTANPVTPLDLSRVERTPSSSSSSSSRIPTRPMSARPRLGTTDPPRVLPRAPSTARPSSAWRPIHQNEKPKVSARIRAVYTDVGRNKNKPTSPPQSSPHSSSHTAASVIQSRVSVFQQEELRHEHLRLVDIVSDLRAVVQHEQAQRLKAMARVRRLEEIVAMKDRKIDGLLNSSSSCSADHSAGGTAQRERHHHSVKQKLRFKLAQQSQLLLAYEDAMHALRSNVKSTERMELEEELRQAYLEISRLHEVTATQQQIIDTQQHQLSQRGAENNQWQAHLRTVQQEFRAQEDENKRLETELRFVQATSQQLELRLTEEQQRRAYEHVVSSKQNPRPASARRPTPYSPRTAEGTAELAESLADIKFSHVHGGRGSTSGGRRPTPMPRASLLNRKQAEDKEREEKAEEPPLPSAPEVDIKRPMFRRMSMGNLITQLAEPVERTLAAPPSALKKADAPREKKCVSWETEEQEEQEERQVEETKVDTLRLSGAENDPQRRAEELLSSTQTRVTVNEQESVDESASHIKALERSGENQAEESSSTGNVVRIASERDSSVDQYEAGGEEGSLVDAQDSEDDDRRRTLDGIEDRETRPVPDTRAEEKPEVTVVEAELSESSSSSSSSSAPSSISPSLSSEDEAGDDPGYENDFADNE